MTTVKFQGGIDILRLPVNEEEHVFPPWYMKYTQSHILHSKCSKTTEESCKKDDEQPCQFCLFSEKLEMPHLPDMVFPNNILILKHKGGAKLEFNALDALQQVSNGRINVKLSCTESWRESRMDNKELLEEKIKPFDWTFTTAYMGTMSGFQSIQTEDKIDMEKLKKKDKILFYVDLTLFEDELHDNGIASLSVKMRVMPGSFYILLRYFLRIDNVMLRVNDTRIHHEYGKNFLLREFTSRESKVEDIKAHPALFVDPNAIAPHLPLTQSQCHKLVMEGVPEQTPVMITMPTVEESKKAPENQPTNSSEAAPSDDI